ALGYINIERFHMNEGHAALLTIELLNERMGERSTTSPTVDDIVSVRRKCVFTTHTPVPAGHHQFSLTLLDQGLGRQDALRSHSTSFRDGHLNMTYLALNLSQYANAVSKRHGEISGEMFPEYHVDSITNGVHAATWATIPFQELFDRRIHGWRRDN